MTVGLFWTIFAGFILGLLMNAFLPMGRLAGSKGLLLAVAIGMTGALAASFAGQGMHWWGREQLPAFVAALVGAGVLLAAGYLFLRPRT
jgi:uncharacterized membrane protein YeaQ/YmgE (transglycosylase-associated protein family)